MKYNLNWNGQRKCVLIDEDDKLTSVDFINTSTKIYVPVFTLYINDNMKFLEI